MLTTTLITLAVIANAILIYICYHRVAPDDHEAENKLIELYALANRNLNGYCDSLESENSRLVTENCNLILRIDELESRLRAMKARQRLGLRAYDVGVNGLYMRHVEGVN